MLEIECNSSNTCAQDAQDCAHAMLAAENGRTMQKRNHYWRYWSGSQWTCQGLCSYCTQDSECPSLHQCMISSSLCCTGCQYVSILGHFCCCKFSSVQWIRSRDVPSGKKMTQKYKECREMHEMQTLDASEGSS